MRPDVVVLDLGLPDIAGQEVLTRIREASAGSQVVVLSASEPDDRTWFEERTAATCSRTRTSTTWSTCSRTSAARSVDVRVLDAPRDGVAGSSARALVRDALGDWGLRALVDDAALIVSELVSNAVTHGGSAFRLQLSRTTSRSGSRSSTRAGHAGAAATGHLAEGGRGLVLVGAMSSAWGVETVPRGKRVWAEIAIP